MSHPAPVFAASVDRTHRRPQAPPARPRGLRIGYSFWGFLGPGITDTPDGGRSHRRTFVDALLAAGHQVVFLQHDRDHSEAGGNPVAPAGHSVPGGTPQWDEHGFPAIDALFLEWRWPIEGRNTTTCDHPGHTCDLHRQQSLLDHYTAAGLATLIWDKDRKLPPDDPWRQQAHVTVLEPALHPTPGAVTFGFPVADADLDRFDPATLAQQPRALSLVYIGNQYDRDPDFDRLFAPAAHAVTHRVAGKWDRAEQWPHVEFVGRVPFPSVAELYRRTVCTVLLLPERYARRGHMTQRLFEAVLAGCLPLAPATIRSVEQFVPHALHITSGSQLADRATRLSTAPLDARAVLLAACARRLEPLRVSRLVQRLDELLPTSTTPRSPPSSSTSTAPARPDHAP